MRAYIRLALVVAAVGAVVVASAVVAVSPGTTERVSVDGFGNQADGSSGWLAINGDGRYVAFTSGATNLVPDDTNGLWDVFVHDRQTGVTERVSVDSAADQGNDRSQDPTISADGRYVAFSSDASNLVAGDTNGHDDVFVHDGQTGATERVSVDSAGNQGNGSSGGLAISADGRYVAFSSYASNLVPGDTSTCASPEPRDPRVCRDVFVHDRQTGATERVSLDSAGNQGNEESRWPAISADGRYVAFESRASNLVPDDTNDSRDVFVHDRGELPIPTPTLGRLTVCPSAGKWAMSVWDGPSATATGDALATCADVSIDAVYWLDPVTQLWWRYFPEWLDVSNLLTLDALQPIIIHGR